MTIANVSASTTASYKVAVAAGATTIYRVHAAVFSSSALNDLAIATSTGVVFGPVILGAGVPAVLPYCNSWIDIGPAKSLGIQLQNAVTANATFVYSAVAST